MDWHGFDDCRAQASGLTTCWLDSEQHLHASLTLSGSSSSALTRGLDLGRFDGFLFLDSWIPQAHPQPGCNQVANPKSISHRCYLREVALEWESTEEIIYLPIGYLQGGE